MRVNPQSPQQLAASAPFKNGIYEAEAIYARDDVSKAGRDMITIDWQIKNGRGVIATIRDYITENTPAAKLRHLCEAAGCLEQYESGELHASLFLGKRARCRVVLVRDRNGMYQDRNAIADYLAGPFVSSAKETAA